MINFGFLAIGIVIYAMPISDLRGYERFKNDEAEMRIIKRVKVILSVSFIIYGSINWLSSIWQYLFS